MNIKDKVKKTISEIESNNKEIEKELDNPNCHNRPGKLQSIDYGKEMILDFEKVLEEMNDGK